MIIELDADQLKKSKGSGFVAAAIKDDKVMGFEYLPGEYAYLKRLGAIKFGEIMNRQFTYS